MPQVQVPLVIEMTDKQAREYAASQTPPLTGDGFIRMKDLVASVQARALTAVQGAPEFSGQAAKVTLKRR